MLQTVVIVVHLLVALGVVALVLLQQSPGSARQFHSWLQLLILPAQPLSLAAEFYPPFWGTNEDLFVLSKLTEPGQAH